MIWRRAYIDTVNDILYSRDDNGSFTLYHRLPGHMSAYAPSLITTNTPPRSTIFAPVKLVRETLICTHLIDSFLLDTPDICQDLTTFHSYLESLDPCLQQVLGNIHNQEIDVDYWVTALQSGIVETASDGSVKNGIGSCAVIFSAGDKELRGEEIENQVLAHVDNITMVAMNNRVDQYTRVAAHTASDIDLLQEIWSHKMPNNVKAQW
eukprot:15341255-Ditylum_brightwellii.AAC.1